MQRTLPNIAKKTTGRCLCLHVCVKNVQQMAMRVDVKNPKVDDGYPGVWVSFQVSSPARGICEKLKQGVKYILDIKKFFKKRSNNANDYMWGNPTNGTSIQIPGLYVSKEEIYRKAYKTGRAV